MPSIAIGKTRPLRCKLGTSALLVAQAPLTRRDRRGGSALLLDIENRQPVLCPRYLWDDKRNQQRAQQNLRHDPNSPCAFIFCNAVHTPLARCMSISQRLLQRGCLAGLLR